MGCCLTKPKEPTGRPVNPPLPMPAARVRQARQRRSSYVEPVTEGPYVCQW